MRSTSHFILISAVCMLAAALGAIPSASAQVGPAAGPSEELEFKIHELQHIPAAEAASMLKKLYPEEFEGGDRMTADERSNSLAIRAPASVQRSIATFLKNSDRADSKRPRAANFEKEAGENDNLELKIFRLKNASASAAERMLSNLFSNEFTTGGANAIVDERTNSLVVRGPASVLELVEALLLNLDQTESKRRPADSSADDIGSQAADSRSSMAAKLRQQGLLSANSSPEFQQYEQMAQAAAQGYREQLAATPKDDARLGQLEADLRGAVHSAFHARQTWQRNHVAEMRKRLDEIEKNISARGQRSNEIIDRRVEDLLNPERQWESEAGPADPEEATVGQSGLNPATLPRTSAPSGDANSFDDNQELQRVAWMDDYAAAADKAHRLRRPLLIFFTAPWAVPSRKMEIEVLRKPVILKLLSQSFAAVRVDLGIPENAHIQKAFEVKAIPTVVVTNQQGAIIVRREGLDNIDQFVALLQSALAKYSDDPAAKRDDGLAPDVATMINKQLFELLRQEQMLLEDHGPLHPKVQAVQRRIKWMRSVLQSAQSFDDSKLQDASTKSSGNLLNDNPETANNSTGAATNGSDDDPRKELLVAENAVLSAKATVEEATIDVDAADVYLSKAREAHKNATVPLKLLLDAENESKRKAAVLNRVRADLQGKERVLALAKEHLEAQIKFAELELKQAIANLDKIGAEEVRANKLSQNKAISMEEFEKAVAASQQARYIVERAKARYDLYRKALPGQSAPASEPTKEGQADTDKPANPTKPGE